MRDITMIPYWKTLYIVLLVTLNVVPVLAFGMQVSWVKPVTAGFSTTFTCSSSCFPNCTYTWSFKGHTVKGSTLTWTPHGLDSTMELQCTVLNPETGVSHSVTSTVEIKNQVSVQIRPAHTVPSLNQSLDLVCHGATPGDLPGTSYLEDQVVWYKDGQKVTLSEKMRLLQNNLTLHFDSLLRSDAGFYQCETYLPKFKQRKVFSLGYLFNFDPWNVSISGPDTVFPGRLSKFTCLTSCTLNVDCIVKWQFRGGFPIGLYFSVHENELRWTPSIPGTFQNFTCIAENPAAGRSAEATKMVEVKDHVCSETIYASENPLPVGSNVTLFSNASVMTGAWLFNNNIIVMIFPENIIITDAWANRVKFNSNTSSLTIMSLQLKDSGVYTLQAINNFYAELTLSVQDGPSNATVMVMPMEHAHRTGSNITLSCTAESNPPATIEWMFDGVSINQFGPQIHLQSVTESDSGNYKCQFYNRVTSRFSSANAMITIMEPIAAVGVNHTGGPAILHEPFTLQCEVKGFSDNIQWWRNGHLIFADNTTVIDMGNKTLTLNPVQYSDDGPMTPVITGPSMALTGTLVTLNCSSASYPPSHFSWYYNDSLVATTSEYQTGPLTLNMSGTYICMAYNNITGMNSTAYKMLTVIVPVNMASIKIVGAQPILNHTFSLMCETAGSVESIIWMHLGFPLYADNTRNFSMDNTILTFDPVMFSDSGNYECKASNPLSSLTSDNFTMNVFYGPEMPVIMGPTAANTGDSVTLNCSASSYPLSLIKWYFSDSLVANTSEYVTPPLTTNMSGNYTCMASNYITGQNSFAYKMLTVYDPIQDVKVETSMNPAIAGHSYMLTCNVTGHAEHVYWMKNGKQLHADNRRIFDMGNITVSFNPVEHNDTGDYQCMAINSVENMTSPAHMLLVNFGPETPITYGPSFAETGRYATFNCSAISVPTSNLSWWFNGSLMANTSVFTTGILSLNMSGEYTCVAYNYVTGKNSTKSMMLTVINAIESVMVKSNTLPIASENFTLTCEVTGYYTSIGWRMNSTNSTDNKLMSYNENKLQFTPVTPYNDGAYWCIATNQASLHESPKYNLLVNYGPMSISISGPDSAKVGLTVSLKCSSNSRPDCDFYWYLNNQPSAVNTGSVITFLASKEREGNYTCKARNPVTNITMYYTKALTVTDHASALHFSSQHSLKLTVLFALFLSVLFH
ncbi:hypothetical protein PAMP_002898 [Pampus punctatissimus]